MVETKAVVFLTVLAVASGLSYYYFFLDDAFISLRYAENLATMGELSYNQGERVEGITNLGYTLILYAVQAHLNPIFWIKIIPLVGFVASVLLFYKLTGNWQVSALLAVDGFYSAWASDGLETSIFSALLLLGLLLADRKRFRLAGLALGASAWFRLDGLLLAGLLLLKYRERGLLLSLIPVAALEAFRLSYFHSLLPNSFPAKIALYSIIVPLWKRPLIAAFKAAFLVAIYPLPLRNLLRNIKDPVAWFPLALFVAYSTTPIGGLRYLAYGIPIMMLYTKRFPRWYFGFVILVSLVLHSFLLQQSYGMTVFNEAGEKLAELNTEKEPVAVADAGLLGFHQKGTRVIDILGLNSKETTSYLQRGDFEGICEYLHSEGVKYVALSQDPVSLEVERCLRCPLLFSQKYPPIVYKNASLKVYECG